MENEIQKFLGTRGASLARKSRVAYGNYLRRCYASLGASSVREWSDDKMSELRDGIDRVYTSKTREIMLTVWRMFVQYAASEGMCVANHEHIRVRPGIPRRREAPTREEFETLMQHLSSQECKTTAARLRNLQARCMLRILYETGVRVAELTSIKVGDQKGRAGELYCAEILSEKSDQYRTVFYTRETQELIEEWEEERIGYGVESDYLFVGVYNREEKISDRISTRAVERTLARACRDAGVRHLSPHFFRHGFVQNRIDEGMSIADLVLYTGHKSIQSVMHYNRRSVAAKAQKIAPHLIRTLVPA